MRWAFHDAVSASRSSMALLSMHPVYRADQDRAMTPTRQAHPMTEAELKGTILKLARAKGWQVFHMVADNIRGSQGKGYPDLTLARDGEVLWMELKQEYGKLSDDQARWQLHLPRMEVIRPSDLARGRVDELLA